MRKMEQKKIVTSFEWIFAFSALQQVENIFHVDVRIFFFFLYGECINN